MSKRSDLGDSTYVPRHTHFDTSRIGPLVSDRETRAFRKTTQRRGPVGGGRTLRKYAETPPELFRWTAGLKFSEKEDIVQGLIFPAIVPASVGIDREFYVRSWESR